MIWFGTSKWMQCTTLSVFPRKAGGLKVKCASHNQNLERTSYSKAVQNEMAKIKVQVYWHQ